MLATGADLEGPGDQTPLPLQDHGYPLSLPSFLGRKNKGGEGGREGEKEEEKGR